MFLVCFNKIELYSWKVHRYFLGVNDKTIIPLTLVGYEKLVSPIYHFKSNARSWNNGF